MYSIIYYSTTQHLSPKPAESWHPWAEWSSRSLPEVLQLCEAMWWTQCLGDTSCLLKFDHLGVSTPFKHISLSLSLSINNSSQNNYSTHFSTLWPAAGQWPGDKTRKKGETGRVPKREYKPSQSGCLKLYEIVLGQSHIQKDLSLSLSVSFWIFKFDQNSSDSKPSCAGVGALTELAFVGASDSSPGITPLLAPAVMEQMEQWQAAKMSRVTGRYLLLINLTVWFVDDPSQVHFFPWLFILLYIPGLGHRTLHFLHQSPWRMAPGSATSGFDFGGPGRWRQWWHFFLLK